MAKSPVVVGILVQERAARAPAVQEIITRFGAGVTCRLGVPGPEKENGLIVLVMEDGNAAAALQAELAGKEGVEVKVLEFGGRKPGA